MTKSQKWALAAFIATLIQTVCAAILPHVEALPPQYRLVGVIVSIIGAAATSTAVLLNQSLSRKHRSIPKRKIERLVREDPHAARKLGIEPGADASPTT